MSDKKQTVEQRKFLNHIRTMIEYWDNEQRSPSRKDALKGLAFSILVAIDGESSACGPYALRPIKGSKQGKDIGGSLHNLFFVKE